MMDFVPDAKNAENIRQQAGERLSAAKELLRLGYYNDAISRIYYSMFSAITLLFYVEGVSFSKHKALITAFHRDFVKTGIFDKQSGKDVSDAFRKRQESDYNASISYDESDASDGVRAAEDLLKQIIEHIEREHPDLLASQ